MPIQSKYSNQQIETLVNILLETLRQQNATTELSLMCLGNTISHIIKTNVPAAQQGEVAKHFSQALQDAVSSKAH
ncbi:DUF1414 domain-containing protein [Rheinheimera sp.]|jgi:uncharacterized protein YejL (UPF0352 family)|uniref:DUF1414 domain-containing protein n=1 Tax=Rheinheimera sp. TaxID=1869214 RepID=UPI0027BAB900|nr:DUF1414 domain-containing protein [Rheinheimera sp.]